MQDLPGQAKVAASSGYPAGLPQRARRGLAFCKADKKRHGARPGSPESVSQKYSMILTQCAVCAADLGLTWGKKCGRCSTRYCGPECQVQHWKEGGHDQLCKKIKRAGGAEQYYANNKYTEAVAVAAEACAEDTKGQTCYICTQALHWKTKEGLVRMCACRGTDGGLRARVVPGGAGEDFGRGGLGEQFGRQGED